MTYVAGTGHAALSLHYVKMRQTAPPALAPMFKGWELAHARARNVARREAELLLLLARRHAASAAFQRLCSPPL